VPKKIRIKKISSAFFEEEFPADLALVIVWFVASIAVIFLPVLNETPLRMVLVLPALLFIPGYCLIAALFPKDDDIGLGERIMLSIGLSIVVVPLIGLGLNFTPWGIRLDPFVISITFFTYTMILLAYYQRAILPIEERFSIPFFTIAGRIRQEILPREEKGVDRFLSVIIVIVFLIAILTTVYVIIIPKEGERFTEFYILGENRTAADFPGRIIAGQNYPMFIGVGNHEYRDMTYRIETWWIRTEFDTGTNTSRIIAMEPADYLSFTLADNESTIIPYNLSVREKGYDLVEFLLFNEAVPSREVNGSDRIRVSYRSVHLWVLVE
jgi:uncharacterized membrane protein